MLSIQLSISTISRLSILVIAIIGSPALFAQEIDFSGDWRPLYHEDLPERSPGPHLADYSGMPINDAARMRGDSYNPNRISVVSEYICRQHGGDYSMRGAADLNISRIVDPLTQQTIAFKTRIGFMGMERTIWLNNPERPAEIAPHTFQGFSTGSFDGNMLNIYTTDFKESYLRRNGLAASSERTATELWVLHGDYLTVVTVIEDPVFMTEPLVRSQSWVRDPSARQAPSECQVIQELPVNALGQIVPHFLPDQNPWLMEFAERYRLPYSGVRGGIETMYPEFMQTMEAPVGNQEFCIEECQ